jgi:glycosyltransferase involved in cell wall biosynthesis
MSSAKLIYDLATEFQRLGHDPLVVAPDESIPDDTEISQHNGITVFRVRTGKIKTASRALRGFNEARLSTLMWEKGKHFFKDNPCDLIVYYSPTIFFGSLVKRLKNLYTCPSYLILRDIFPQWAVDAGVLRKGLAYRYFKLKESQNYRAADIIGVQSPANLSYFKENGLDRRYRTELLYNWAALKEDNIQPANYRERMGLQGKVVFFYGGNLGIAQDMDNIIRLAKNIEDEQNVHFLLVGDGSEKSRLKTSIVSNRMTNITIHDAVDQQEYLSMLSEFDVGLISLDRNLRTQNFPGKLLGYMYHSMPTLASINPGNDLKEILEKHDAGFVCINGDDGLLVSFARRLAASDKLRREMGLNARALLESTFSVSRAANQILANFTG